MVRSSVMKKNGTVVLCVNGEEIPGNAYITYFHEKGRYEDFAKCGYKLFSVPFFFGNQTINECTEIPPFSPGIFEDDENPDFSVIDREIADILAACPNAYIFPRVNMSLPRRWEEEHPDELNDVGNFKPDKRRACFSSDAWAKETKRLLKLFIEHIENSDYRDNICGYQLAGGNTEEWFSFDFKGSIGKRSREKFSQYIAKNGLEGTNEEYYEFLSLVVAERICEFSSYAKQLTGRRLVIGCFYGYNFERPDKDSCHNALQTVLDCDDVDFICSPVSYGRERAGGMDHPCMLAVDSLKKHGKLYFVENDSRTHLTKPLFDIPHFQRPVFMAREKELSVENIKLHYARALTHSHALWWFDMGGGWYADSCYMDMFKKFLEITKSSMSKDMSSISETALLIDPKMLNSITLGDKNYAVVYKLRFTMGLTGVPYDSFLISDFEDIKDKYKAFIIPCPIMTAATEKLLNENKNVFPVKADVTALELRQFCNEHGVHIYSEKDAVVFANKSYLFLHTTSSGIYNISMPSNKELRQIFGKAVDLKTDILDENSGYLFEIV